MNPSGLPDFHTNPASRAYHFSPIYIRSTVQEDKESDDEEDTVESSSPKANTVYLRPLLINSPADLVKLVPRRTLNEEDRSSETSSTFSASQDETRSPFPNSPEENEENKENDEERNSEYREDSNEEVEFTMDRDFSKNISEY